MIGSSENRISYNGNGIATEFAYTFKILEKSDIKVLHVAIDGTEELLTKDYYVDMEKSVVLYPGYAPGAEIPEQNRPPILPVGERLVLYREVPITQESALDKHWPFNVIEAGLDKLTIICQQLFDRLQRSFYVSESTSTNFDTKVPIEAGKTFRVKDDGTGFEVTEDPGKVIDGAKALLKQTMEQAELAKEQADASSQSAVSAQNAANAAEKFAENPIGESFEIEGITYYSAKHYASQADETAIPSGSLSINKLAIGALGYVTPQMFKTDSITWTQAIQSALDYAHTNGIDMIVLPFGVYTIDGKIHVYSNQTLKGIGGVIKVADNYATSSSTNYYVVENLGESNTTFDNLIIYGNSANNTQYKVCDSITACGAGTIVRNCKLYDAVDSAIMFSNCAGGQVINNYIYGTNDCGIYVNADDNEDNAKGVLVFGNTIKDSKSAGIALKRIAKNVNVVSNYIENTGTGISHEQASTTSDFSTDTLLSQNRIINYSLSGILIRGGSNHIITNNYLSCMLTSGIPYSINIEGCNTVTVANNYIKNNVGTGVYLTDRKYDTTIIPCENIIVSANQFDGETARRAILISGNNTGVTFKNISINNNICKLSASTYFIQHASSILIEKFIISGNIGNGNTNILAPINDTTHRIHYFNNLNFNFSTNIYNIVVQELGFGAILVSTPSGTYHSSTNYKYGDIVLNNRPDNHKGISHWAASADGIGSTVMVAVPATTTT